jgi:hypothetical protein
MRWIATNRRSSSALNSACTATTRSTRSLLLLVLRYTSICRSIQLAAGDIIEPVSWSVRGLVAKEDHAGRPAQWNSTQLPGNRLR